MIQAQELKQSIENGGYDEQLRDLYLDEESLAYQKKRYVEAILTFEQIYGAGEISVFSAPGRSEIGGNHTDHQRGEVLAAAVNVDAIAVVRPDLEPVVRLVSGEASMLTISLSELSKDSQEEGTTLALVKGVLAGIRERGYEIGGFSAYITSDVLIGAGLSSSAAFETLIGTIISGLYNEEAIPAVVIAGIGQYAENEYFGKPCGLMDQMASSVGHLVHIDFADKDEPKVEKIECDFDKFGYSLCITDTKSSHADCTPEYAAIPCEMKQVAAVFGKEVLREVPEAELFERISEIREKAGDRAMLRAIHFAEENKRVQMEVQALGMGDFEGFLCHVKASGDSSFKYLQNVYSSSDVQHQNVSLALALSDAMLGGAGVSRVHGGGFAGTIQAFVKNEAVEDYQKGMNRVFGKGSCHIYKIRKYGGKKVM